MPASLSFLTSLGMSPLEFSIILMSGMIVAMLVGLTWILVLTNPKEASHFLTPNRSESREIAMRMTMEIMGMAILVLVAIKRPVVLCLIVVGEAYIYYSLDYFTQPPQKRSGWWALVTTIGIIETTAISLLLFL